MVYLFDLRESELDRDVGTYPRSLLTLGLLTNEDILLAN